MNLRFKNKLSTSLKILDIKILSLQWGYSPFIEEVIYFHDYSIFFMTLIILSMFFYLISSDLFNFYLTRYFIIRDLLEIYWTLLPIVILFFIAFPSLRLLYLYESVDDIYLTIKCLGHQWFWSYEYNDFSDFFFDSYMVNRDFLRLLDVDNRIILPLNYGTRLVVSSQDVLHSWAVPSLGIKVDANPGRLNQIVLPVKNIGVFYGQCSEICGSLHSYIPIVMEVVRYDIFEKWIS